MREKIFRGKRVDNGEWVYGVPIKKYGKTYIIKDTQSYAHTTYKQSSVVDFLATAYEVVPKSVGEYTNLTDKKGIKIFERDILKCNDNPKDLVKAVFGEFVVIDLETERKIDTVIGWHYEVIPTDELSKTEPFCFAMPLTAHYVECCSMEVIGNIHDNPELVKE